MISRTDAQSFDRVAAQYDRLGDLARIDHVGRWLGDVLPTAGDRALDLGCGSGRHAVLLAERFGKVDAVDVSGPMIELARRRRPRPNISYRRADLHEVADTGGYDFICGSGCTGWPRRRWSGTSSAAGRVRPGRFTGCPPGHGWIIGSATGSSPGTSCAEVFPGCELRACGGPRAIAVIWDAAAASVPSMPRR